MSSVSHVTMMAIRQEAAAMRHGLPVDVPAHMALQVGLQAAPHELECLVFSVLPVIAHAVDDQALHCQRLAVIPMLFQNLRQTQG